MDDKKCENLICQAKAPNPWLQPGPVISMLVIVLIIVSLFVEITHSDSREAFQAKVSAEHETHLQEMKLMRLEIESIVQCD